ncbi:MAG: hypothetical protein JWQ10_2977 [Herbaspirillum sp.]|nr:hypothetical protein [Herbaspirillum sp.]
MSKILPNVAPPLSLLVKESNPVSSQCSRNGKDMEVTGARKKASSFLGGLKHFINKQICAYRGNPNSSALKVQNSVEKTSAEPSPPSMPSGESPSRPVMGTATLLKRLENTKTAQQATAAALPQPSLLSGDAIHKVAAELKQDDASYCNGRKIDQRMHQKFGNRKLLPREYKDKSGIIYLKKSIISAQAISAGKFPDAPSGPPAMNLRFILKTSKTQTKFPRPSSLQEKAESSGKSSRKAVTFSKKSETRFVF